VDRDSFDRLMLEHLSAAHRLAIRLAGDVDRAEDLVQEAMLRASRCWSGFRGQSKFTTWLFAIVINVFRDQLRKKGADEAIDEDLRDARSMEPRELLSGSELAELIARHVSSLPPRQREVLVLVTYEGLSIAETAGLLQITAQNVHSNLHAARERLRTQLLPHRVQR
jgi:RNA polymerase sigma-70 factor (ECF subfamily)